MSNDPNVTPPAAANSDALLSALTYPIPIVGIVILLSDSMKNNPALRRHAVQSIALGVVLFVISIIIGLIPIIGCLTPILWLGITLYYAYQAYQGKDVTIPVITDFCRNQKWF